MPAQADSGLIQLLEHVNINIPDHAWAKVFYFKLLGLTPDPRRAENVASGRGTLWANIGPCQVGVCRVTW